MSTPAMSREDGAILTAVGRLEGKFEQHAENVDQRFEDLNHALFGNGQPGVLADMREEINTLKNWKTATETADHTNQKWRKTVQGTIYAGCVFIGSVPNWFPFLLSLFKGKQGH